MKLSFTSNFLVKYIKATASLVSSPSFARPYEYRGRMILHSDDIVTFQMGIGAIAYQEDNINYIVVDDQFFTWPEYVQDFILAHEEGHIEMHMDLIGKDYRKKRMKAVKRNELLLEEDQADRYAALEVGTEQSIEALRWLKELYLQQMGKSFTTKEIDIRIEKLMEFSKQSA